MMKALVYHGPGQRGWDTVDDPTIIDQTDIVVRIDTSTICGMLLAVGDIMQWLAMIAILVAQNAQGSVQDKQVEHLNDLGMTTHRLVVENTALTEAIHHHFIAADTGSRPARQ